MTRLIAVLVLICTAGLLHGEPVANIGQIELSTKRAKANMEAIEKMMADDAALEKSTKADLKAKKTELEEVLKDIGDGRKTTQLQEARVLAVYGWTMEIVTKDEKLGKNFRQAGTIWGSQQAPLIAKAKITVTAALKRAKGDDDGEKDLKAKLETLDTLLGKLKFDPQGWAAGREAEVVKIYADAALYENKAAKKDKK